MSTIAIGSFTYWEWINRKRMCTFFLDIAFENSVSSLFGYSFWYRILLNLIANVINLLHIFSRVCTWSWNLTRNSNLTRISHSKMSLFTLSILFLSRSQIHLKQNLKRYGQNFLWKTPSITSKLKIWWRKLVE